MKALTPVLGILSIAVLLLASCAPGPNTLRGTQDEAGKVAGFWKGIWHGFITPITFIVSLFNKNVNVYESRNSGGWYNFGYVLGLSMIFGGGGRGSHGVRRRSRED
ncbi:MAG: hypothetical protein A4E73_01428 [Syntrophaceae bacterium PtaU1.Bin231]|nr:MAG: hypothetical protein A4E73_01428 [Syntrophaceae bacterium PtaU1.Bin231]